MRQSDYYFTVFTPTYNRAHILHRVYNSLCAQTFTDFEWLIIDDGSIDNTSELVTGWQAENYFPIRYHFQENQGKHIAWNRAADLARGEYFLCADSDDEFVPEALDRFRACVVSIPDADHDRFFGIAALCKNPAGQIVGEEFPRHLTDSDFIELYFNYKIRGEKWYCGRTEIYRTFRLSEAFTGSYLPEGTLWFRIARKYKVRLLNEPLRIYHTEPQSICNARAYPKNAAGMRLLSHMFLCDFMDFRNTFRKEFLLQAVTYLRSCFHLGIPTLQQVRDLNNMPARILWAAMLPKGLALYLYDKYRSFSQRVKQS